jgi:hypothetical protein
LSCRDEQGVRIAGRHDAVAVREADS